MCWRNPILYILWHFYVRIFFFFQNNYASYEPFALAYLGFISVFLSSGSICLQIQVLLAFREEVGTAESVQNCFGGASFDLCSGRAPGSLGTSWSFHSVTIPDDPRALVFSRVRLSGICSTEDGWISSYWHLLWTKGGTNKHPVFWVAGKFSEGFHEFCFKARFVFCFQFEHFTIKKEKISGFARYTY